jgi:hypothetical protein
MNQFRQAQKISACAICLALGVITARGEETEMSSAETMERPKVTELRVLFLGDSLTAANELPALVQSMAATRGTRLTYQAITPGGVSLEDHWLNGKGRTALARGHWDFLVLQQAPSSQPDGQTQLREWAVRWAKEARDHGATPALYMVWPFQGEAGGFKLVAQSYRQAAITSQLQLFAVGDAWDATLRSNRSIRLYQPDKLHPTAAGSYLAALVITQGLTGLRPTAIPSTLNLADGRVFQLLEAQAKKLRQSAEKVIETSSEKSVTPR